MSVTAQSRQPRRDSRERLQDHLDTRALELASQAIGRLDDHQQECRDRYLEQRGQLASVSGDIAALRTAIVGTVVKAAGAIIIALLGAIGTLVGVILSHAH